MYFPQIFDNFISNQLLDRIIYSLLCSLSAVAVHVYDFF